MSTKCIEVVVSMMGCAGFDGCNGRGDHRCLRCSAEAELRDIRRAAQAVTNEEPDVSDTQHHDLYTRLKTAGMVHLRAIAEEAE